MDSDTGRIHYSFLDKSAQLRTFSQSSHLKGSDDEDFDTIGAVNVSDKQGLVRRARAKFITDGVTNHLCKIQGSPLHSAYENTLLCGSELLRSGDKIKSVHGYCKNRWCMVCNRIRTAKNIDKYLGILQGWSNKQFVTLTIPNVQVDRLVGGIASMETGFKIIRERYGKRFRRGGSIQFQGLRKLEVTYNPVRNDYHPHYHLVISDLDFANTLVCDWLEIMPGTNRGAQDVRPADERSTKELFKYFTKLISSRTSSQVKRGVYVENLDWIFRAIRGRRTFQNFGFTCNDVVSVVQEDITAVKGEIDNEMFYTWQQEFTDWVSVDTGDMLTGYKPSQGMSDLFSKISQK